MRLTRSRTDTIIGGVASGMAKHFNMDPVVMRLIWFIGFLISGGTSALVYFLMWLIVPEESIGE